MVTVYATLAGIVPWVVYNFARISLSEQGREMASQVGFTRHEVSALLLGSLLWWCWWRSLWGG
jgi:putative ABC transport system permease protein